MAVFDSEEEREEIREILISYLRSDEGRALIREVLKQQREGQP